MKSNIVRFLYAVDCYLLYILSGIAAAAGVVAYYSINAASDFDLAGVGYAAFVDVLPEFLSGKSSIVLLVSYIIVLFGILVVFLFKKQSLAGYSGMSYYKIKSLFFSLALGICLSLITYSFVPAKTDEGIGLNTAMVLCIILGPFVEELMFRGILLKMFASSVGIFFGAIITSVLFAVSHTDPVQVIYTFVLGLVLASVRVKSTSLWSAVALHAAFNICGAFVWGTGLTLSSTATVLCVLLSFLFFVFACSGGRKKAHRKSV
ncbi:MAG: CPBP family intramembrane metalloprotease [Oscillospiraceae bacterium]|nr:CPBP family intramembrane metalloprotease [Oscillospiraceae bacterium]